MFFMAELSAFFLLSEGSNKCVYDIVCQESQCWESACVLSKTIPRNQNFKRQNRTVVEFLLTSLLVSYKLEM